MQIFAFFLKRVLSLKIFEGERYMPASRRHGIPRPTERAFYILFVAPKRLIPAVQRAVKILNSSASHCTHCHSGNQEAETDEEPTEEVKQHR